uniref:Sperm-associated antigen 7 homolog n=1 Tax=Phallusia mammillata TaxID=59560 RepID=A0A6F9DU05_9ASCI|nr:sperm-associated antigen 7 homolog [Phallusia mammillata]
MADLLGSILGSMQKPPTASEEERKKAKAHQEKLKKLQKVEREQKEKFRVEVEKTISDFARDSSKTRHRLKAMNKLQRTIVHEIAEIAGITSQAFGVEDNDRYVMLFKKEDPPTEDEINAYKHGEEWNKETQEKVKQQKIVEVEESKHTKSNDVSEPMSNYKDKYNHLIGTSAAKDAARRTEANKTFGMVPSTNKRDQRSIEETLNQIRAKKRQKVSDEEPSS